MQLQLALVLLVQRWDFARWQPQLVVVNLMTNDYAPPPPASDVMLTAWLSKHGSWCGFVLQHLTTIPGATLQLRAEQ